MSNFHRIVTFPTLSRRNDVVYFTRSIRVSTFELERRRRLYARNDYTNTNCQSPIRSINERTESSQFTSRLLHTQPARAYANRFLLSSFCQDVKVETLVDSQCSPTIKYQFEHFLDVSRRYVSVYNNVAQN